MLLVELGKYYYLIIAISINSLIEFLFAGIYFLHIYFRSLTYQNAGYEIPQEKKKSLLKSANHFLVFILLCSSMLAQSQSLAGSHLYQQQQTTPKQQNTAFAINLIGFSGHSDNDVILLQWRTSGEINVNHFELQAGTNGIHFENINRQTAKSINKSTEDYKAEDFKPSPGNNFYKLKVVSNNGKTIYSKIITVKYNRK